MGGSGSKPSVPALASSTGSLHSIHTEHPSSAGNVAVQCGTYQSPEKRSLEQLSNAYKEDTPYRVGAKAAIAGAAGFVLGPFAHSGPVLASAFVTAANGAAVIGFYDVLREALTSLTLSDTPLVSFVAGGLTGAHAPSEPFEPSLNPNMSLSSFSVCVSDAKHGLHS
jgi:hypothetical protein